MIKKTTSIIILFFLICNLASAEISAEVIPVKKSKEMKEYVDDVQKRKISTKFSCKN